MRSETSRAVLLRRACDDALSAEGWALYGAIRAEVPAAYVDLAQIGLCRPVPGDDPGHHRLKSAALALMWRTYRAAGVRVLVVSGRVDDGRDVARYADALSPAGLPLSVFRSPEPGDDMALAAIAQDVLDRLR